VLRDSTVGYPSDSLASCWQSVYIASCSILYCGCGQLAAV